MHFTLVLYMTKKYGEMISHTFLSNYPDYTINIINTKEIPDKCLIPANSIFLCDTDERIYQLTKKGFPVIAVSHKDNSYETLMGTPWLILSPKALTPSLLNEVYCRHHHLPIIIGETARCIIRELSMRDLTFLLRLQKENQSNPDGCFFPQDCTSFDEFLFYYIQSQYEFYQYGIFAVIEKQSDSFLGVAGFSTPKLSQSFDFAKLTGKTAEISYALLKQWQHQGFADEVIKKLISLGKKVYKFEHIIARIHRNNKPSISVATKNDLPIWLYEETQSF